MRRALVAILAAVVATAAVLVVLGSGNGATHPSYWVELDNAFGLAGGVDARVGGVRVGHVTDLGLTTDNHARVRIQIDRPGFGQFRADAFCETRPQSVIGEYYVDCQPGTTGRPLRDGATIPVSHTATTVPADLVTGILRLPYRERFRLIIGELGAGLAGRGDDLNSAIRRAVPALRKTDDVLAILATQNRALGRLVSDSDTVVTALARGRRGVSRFVRFGRRTAVAAAERQVALRATLRELPPFLEQLPPTAAKLGRVADTLSPALSELSASAPQLTRFFTDLAPFGRASTPALGELGRALVPGRRAVVAALPTVAELNRAATGTPELSQNLSIILRHLDNRRFRAENDARANAQLGVPAGVKTGYTGLEALLMYPFDQTLAISPFTKLGHMLRVVNYAGSPCGPYQSATTLRKDLARKPATYRKCEAWLGPNQPGITRPDPTAGSARSASATAAATPAAASTAPSTATSAPAAATSAGDASLLNYLLAP